MKSRANSQMALPPMEVRKSEASSAAFRKSEDHDAPFRFPEHLPLSSADEAQALAADIFNEALKTTRIGKVVGLQRKEVAEVLGVSQNLVDRWCNPNESACPSFAQMLCMPWAFHVALHREMNRRFGFGRAVLARLLSAVGECAAVLD